MSKITINDITSQFAASVALNARFQQIEDELNNNVLYREVPEGEPNEMNNPLDMNHFPIINLDAPVDPTDVVRLQDLEEYVLSFVPSMADLQDVDLSPPATDGQVLVYDAGTETWIPETLSVAAPVSLTDLDDVDAAMSPSEGQVLTYTSGEWTAETPAPGGSGKIPLTADVNVTVGAAGDYATLLEAINDGYATYEAPEAAATFSVVFSGPRYIIELLADYVWEDTIAIANKDLSWMTITGSTVTEITIPTLLGVPGSSDAAMSLVQASSPRIDVDLEGTGSTAADSTMFSVQYSTLSLNLSRSFSGFDTILGARGSVIQVIDFVGDMEMSGFGQTVSLIDSTVSSLCNWVISTDGTNPGDALSMAGSRFFCGELQLYTTASGNILDMRSSQLLCSYLNVPNSVPSRILIDNSKVDAEAIYFQTTAGTPGPLTLSNNSQVTVNTQCDIIYTAPAGAALVMENSALYVNFATTINGGGVSLEASQLTVDDFTCHATYGGPAGAGDIVMATGSIIRCKGTRNATSPIAANTLTASGILWE